MNNPLYVTVTDTQNNVKKVIYYVTVGCKLKDVIEEIQQELEPEFTIIKASYSRE